MDKKSGVYYYLTDNSLRVGGSSEFSGIVPMYTTKGTIGKRVEVTARNFREKLGFDLGYNQNYVGLERMLQSVARLEVLRCNKDSTVAYKIWSADGTPQSALDFGSADAVAFNATDNSVWVSCNSPGTWGNDFFVCFSCDGTPGDSSAVYTLHIYSVLRNVFSSVGEFEFSLSENSDIFYKNVSFGDFSFGFKGSFPSSSEFFVDVSQGFQDDAKYKLHEGSNGSKLSASDVPGVFQAIDSSLANVVVMNGFIENPMTSGVGIIKAVMAYCGGQDRSVFLDAPVIMDSSSGILRATDDLFEWTKSLYDKDVGQYAQVSAVPDKVDVDGASVLIQPSVHLFGIYARMFATYGHVNFPPAGNTYGSVSVNSLLESDFYLYGDELKTNRVNYLTSTSHGVCMWEYRTLYSLGNSDLSYANTPFILRDLKGRLMSFMENFNFCYTTPVELLSIQSGLDSILSLFKRNFFLVDYSLVVPSYEEAQAAGRELSIDISAAVINSADVIILRASLKNAANIR